MMENELNKAEPDELDSSVLPKIEEVPESFDPPGSEDDSEPEIASPDSGDAGPEVEPVAEPASGPKPVEPLATVVTDRGSATPAAVGANPLVLGLTIALVFVIGLLTGFFGRPAIIEDLPIEVVVTVVPDQSQAVAQNTTQSASQSNPTGGEASQQPDANVAPGEPTPTIMDFVMSDARHIQGDEAAPVTIVEFSDFN